MAKPRLHDTNGRDPEMLQQVVSWGVDGLSEAYKLLSHLVSDYQLSPLDKANLARAKRIIVEVARELQSGL